MYAETLFSDLRHGAAAQALPFTLNVLCFLSTNTTEHKTVLEIFSLKISHLQPLTQGCCLPTAPSSQLASSTPTSARGSARRELCPAPRWICSGSCRLCFRRDASVLSLAGNGNFTVARMTPAPHLTLHKQAESLLMSNEEKSAGRNPEQISVTTANKN